MSDILVRYGCNDSEKRNNHCYTKEKKTYHRSCSVIDYFDETHDYLSVSTCEHLSEPGFAGRSRFVLLSASEAIALRPFRTYTHDEPSLPYNIRYTCNPFELFNVYRTDVLRRRTVRERKTAVARFRLLSEIFALKRRVRCRP